MANLKENIERMKTETFGCEIEMYHITQQGASRIIARVLNEYYRVNTCDVIYDGSHLHNYVVVDPTGRKWQCVSDSSINGFGGACEFVTPILRYDDIELLQTIVRALRNAGAKSDDRTGGCGVHIHVGIKNDQYPATPKSIRNLANIVKNHERLIVKSIKMSRNRYTGFARGISQRLIDELNAKKPDTWDKLKDLHYRVLGGGTSHYSDSRYYFLNLHAVWDKGTTEFRCFEFQGQLHAGWLKAWIQLCLAIVSYSKIVSYARPHEVYDTNEKYCMKTWLTNLGLIGDEFKTCRTLMLRRLDGDASQKTPRTIGDCLDDLGLDIDQ